MQRNDEFQIDGLIDLGAATVETKGTIGQFEDSPPVAGLPNLVEDGISVD